MVALENSDLVGGRALDRLAKYCVAYVLIVCISGGVEKYYW